MVVFTAVDAPSWVNNYAYFNNNWREYVRADVTGLWFGPGLTFSGSLWGLSQTKSELVNKGLIQKCRFCCHHIDISRKLQQDIETQPPKCWQQFVCAIATCWKCVLQVRKYEPASVLSLRHDPESSFHQGWNGLGSNRQKLVAASVCFVFFFIQGQAHFEARNRRKTRMGSLIKCHSEWRR